MSMRSSTESINRAMLASIQQMASSESEELTKVKFGLKEQTVNIVKDMSPQEISQKATQSVLLFSLTDNCIAKLIAMAGNDYASLPPPPPLRDFYLHHSATVFVSSVHAAAKISPREAALRFGLKLEHTFSIANFAPDQLISGLARIKVEIKPKNGAEFFLVEKTNSITSARRVLQAMSN